MNPLSASQSTVCGLAWKRYLRQTPLRDVAPALNGRARLARVRPCRTGAASFMVARARGPRTPEGLERSRRANWKHGHFSREAKAERSRVRAAILALRGLDAPEFRRQHSATRFGGRNASGFHLALSHLLL